ncbi:hypothetical protein B4102_0954 [Heyndrickxia sporothermodurans]|uniref:Uncharacterized protein n=1 Tax=Heyndrickxia sporothermodurans TaxID=46224 RepID=A0A150KJZ1_9BACI|nr:hypothetical protein B4102_0954 [Heyndrickxia sporothermodurans]
MIFTSLICILSIGEIFSIVTVCIIMLLKRFKCILLILLTKVPSRYFEIWIAC